MHYLFLLAIPFLAFAYRARGGAISLGPNNTQLARILFWGIPIGVVDIALCYVWHIPIWIAAPGAILGWVSAILGHSSEQEDVPYPDNVEMGLVTSAMLLIISLPFGAWFWFSFNDHEVFHNPSTYFMVGMLGAATYIIGWRTPWTLNIGSLTWCLPKSTEWGEFFTGAFAFGLPLSIFGILS